MKDGFDKNEDGLVSHFTIDGGFELPNIFANRSVWALWMLKTKPELAQVDPNGLVWFENENDGFWYSVAGNYSSYSPQEKIQKQARLDAEQLGEIETAKEYYQRVLYFSGIRKQVLERDDYTCQMCGLQKKTKLHVHHVLKRREGGSDCLDNLLTVCPSCHGRADTSLYNPDWVPDEGELSQ